MANPLDQKDLVWYVLSIAKASAPARYEDLPEQIVLCDIGARNEWRGTARVNRLWNATCKVVGLAGYWLKLPPYVCRSVNTQFCVSPLNENYFIHFSNGSYLELQHYFEGSFRISVIKFLHEPPVVPDPGPWFAHDHRKLNKHKYVTITITGLSCFENCYTLPRIVFVDTEVEVGLDRVVSLMMSALPEAYYDHETLCDLTARRYKASAANSFWWALAEHLSKGKPGPTTPHSKAAAEHIIKQINDAN
jgi:hypothetical protein